MTGAPLAEGQIPQVQDLRKCNGCPRVTRGCRHCKEQGRAAPYDHLCQACHFSALGQGVDHRWEAVAAEAGPIAPQ